MLMLVLQCAMLALADDSDGTKLCNPTEMINVNTCCEWLFAPLTCTRSLPRSHMTPA